MKKSLIAAGILTFTGLSAVTTPVLAYQAGDWLVRGRIINVNPNDSSGALRLDGDRIAKGVGVDSDTVPELDITYMITPNWGVELILGTSKHTVRANKTVGSAVSGLGSKNVIDTRVLPPTLTLQYHFRPGATVRPYVGAGVNYTYFYNEKVPRSSAIHATDGSRTKVNLSSSWGWAAQAGVDVAINQDWFINFDVKYLDINTTARFKNINGALGERAKIKADINPFVWGVGIGRRF